MVATSLTVGFNTLSGVCAAPSGNMFVADSGAHTVRGILYSNQFIGDFAGISGTSSMFATNPNGDNGKATSATLYQPFGVYESSSSIYIADRQSHKIRKVNSLDSIITTVAGNIILQFHLHSYSFFFV